jgi:hypothetical protein
MGLASKLATFARSPQGKRAFREAARLAKDPKTRARIADARRQLSKGRTPAK